MFIYISVLIVPCLIVCLYRSLKIYKKRRLLEIYFIHLFAQNKTASQWSQVSDIKMYDIHGCEHESVPLYVEADYCARCRRQRSRLSYKTVPAGKFVNLLLFKLVKKTNRKRFLVRYLGWNHSEWNADTKQNRHIFVKEDKI